MGHFDETFWCGILMKHFDETFWGDAEEVIKGLEEQTSAIPAKVLLHSPDHLLSLALPGQLPVTCQAVRGQKIQVSDFQNRKALSHP